MRKYIAGSRYDTDTARKLAYWSNGLTERDFAFCCETLYRTQAGKFFLHGEGHGNSKYGEWHGNTGGWGEKIIPLLEQEAREWAEENLDADEVDEIFAAAAQGRVAISASISRAAKEALDELAADEQRPNSQVVEDAIMAYARAKREERA